MVHEDPVRGPVLHAGVGASAAHDDLPPRVDACTIRFVQMRRMDRAHVAAVRADVGDLDVLEHVVPAEVIPHIRVQTIVPPAITMTLYFIIFGNLIGRRIGVMDGYDYMQYIAPGLIMMSVITNSYGNVVSSFFGAKFGRHVEEMLVSPMSNAAIIIGHVAGGVLRGVLVGLLVTVIALFFTRLEVQHPIVTITIVLLSSTVFALAGFINAVFAKKFDDISIIPTFVLTPLTYLGGVFYSISLLPDFWQKASLANPILYMVNAFRYGILGTSDIGIGKAYAIILAAIALSILVKSGYDVVAVNGIIDEADYLLELGAKEVISIDEADDQSGRPLLRPRWAGAIDTVAGNILSTAIKATRYGGSVTCCGNVGAAELHSSIYPFIINGVTLLGIDSVNCPVDMRMKVWNKVAADWKLDRLEKITTELPSLEALEERIALILEGKNRGRAIVKVAE